MKDTYTIATVRQNNKISTYYYKNGHLIDWEREKDLWGSKLSCVEEKAAKQLAILEEDSDIYRLESIVII